MKTFSKKKSRNFKKRCAFGTIQYAINGIEKKSDDPSDWEAPYIKAFLHRIILTGDWHKCKGYYKTLINLFGAFYLDTDFTPDGRMPNYRKKWIKNTPDFSINVFSEPIEFQAPYYMELLPKGNVSPEKYKELLQRLNSSLKILHVRSIEYSIDLYCHDRESLQRLFLTLRRYLHIPYQRDAKLYGEKHIAWGDKTRMNTVYKASDVKMYERGPDGKKKRIDWNVEDCDRVRLEFTANKTALRQRGISTLDDLISDARFYEINHDIYKFIYFEGSKKLPQCWEGYTSSDERGNMNCLQLEINNFRNRIKNLNQYLKEAEAFDPLRLAIVDAMHQFDEKWVNA